MTPFPLQVAAIAALMAGGEAGRSTPAVAGSDAVPAWRADRGDGTYRNPPLYADYPDPDIIRVGADFYFATTTFANVPGLTILQSRDLVNWDIVSHVVQRLTGRSQYDLEDGTSYRRGLFAPSLRYHDGTFYVAVTPVGQNTRIYRTRDVRGPWEMNALDREAFDPALFFDGDGRPYLFTSIGTDGTVTMLTLSRDLRRVEATQVVHFNRGAEGSKVVRRGDYYYMFNAIPSRLALTVSRARELTGPWETRPQIDDTTGGHQGAIVDLPDGSWYGFVMVDAGAIGRMTNISPVFWQDDWPVWGTPGAPGRVPASAPMPIQGHTFREPPTSDDFSGPALGRQWQWNHNPEDGSWSLTARPGFLRLRATRSDRFWTARNTLTQKGQGPASRGEVALDIGAMRPGDQCGFGTFGKYSGQIVVNGGDGGARHLSMRVMEDRAEGPRTETRVARRPIAATRLWLRTDMDFTTDRARLSYSEDGRTWTELGGAFPLAYDWRTGTFQGQQFAIFCYNPGRDGGWIDVDHFVLSGITPGRPERRYRP
ncbi:glycoside hydrolase 43 family protein [Sphingosinicella sp. LHD-64]|uniref:glycoside hydrolase family 43 protein n=1 Tax=Sphingosinicella sp. LHD-64 TaxID=3072139 RepID=UPI00280E6A4C|nr:glycoside hydrolase 43 family protein [Sphingosinicella sp. LHD-64]MDQ8755186.1 glycoside hydrolase 43 family protein [Sphingosinicella sp. LHD-64]